MRKAIDIKKKNIIKNAFDVNKTLYNLKLPDKNASPHCDNSKRIAIETNKPRTPEKVPNKKYKLPIFL